MPTAEKHQEQTVRYKRLLQQPELNPTTSEFTDWAITIAFYTAVHLVERELAKVPYHSTHHDDREQCMFKTGGNLRAIFSDYKTLKAASLRTRYKCCVFSAEETNKYLECLHSIENKLGKVG